MGILAGSRKQLLADVCLHVIENYHPACLYIFLQEGQPVCFLLSIEYHWTVGIQRFGKILCFDLAVLICDGQLLYSIGEKL